MLSRGRVSSNGLRVIGRFLEWTRQLLGVSKRLARRLLVLSGATVAKSPDAWLVAVHRGLAEDGGFEPPRA